MSTHYSIRPWLKHYDYWVPEHLNYPERPLHEILDTAVVDVPDRPATSFFGATLTFEEIKDRSDRLAVALDQYGIAKGDRVGIMLKEIGKDTRPQPNHTRHAWARWDAYVHTPNPDGLFEELREKNVTFHRPISDTEDGLRAFEILDSDGYVLCFGRPK